MSVKIAKKPTLGFVGAGKVGTTLARLLYERGYVVSVVCSRNSGHSSELAASVEAQAVASAAEVAAAADLTFLTVPDDALSSIVLELAEVSLEGKAVVHTSGVHEAAVLNAVISQGAMIGSVHPAFPFATVEESIKGLPGSTFALQVENDLLREWLVEIIKALDGQVFEIASGQKALYHSALVFASNYGVTLYAIAQQLLLALGAAPMITSSVLNTLMAGMMHNLQLQGIPDALTGPLVRGDAGTIEAHLAALHAHNAKLAALYVQLAEQTVPLAKARGVDTHSVESILIRKIDDADNHT